MSKPSSHNCINKWQENKNKRGGASCGIMLIPDFMKIHPLVEKLLRVSHMDMIWMVTHTPKIMIRNYETKWRHN
jgi:hypothetical protein